VQIKHQHYARHNILQDALKTLDKIDIVYAHNDPMAHGAFLAARAAGREKAIRFLGIDGIPGEGCTWVKKGALLFVIDPSEYEANLHAAQAELRAADAEFKRAEIEFARAQRVFELTRFTPASPVTTSSSGCVTRRARSSAGVSA